MWDHGLEHLRSLAVNVDSSMFRADNVTWVVAGVTLLVYWAV